MEEFGFNKIDEDDIYESKESIDNMKSLYDIQSMQNQTDGASLDDIDITSTVPNIDSIDDNDINENNNTDISVKNISDTFVDEGQINPPPNPINFEDTEINSTVNSINPLEYTDTNDTLTVETSKNLEKYKQLTFDLKNPTYKAEQSIKASNLEQTMNATPTPSSKNVNFDVAKSTASNNTSNRRLRKSAPPDWRARHG